MGVGTEAAGTGAPKCGPCWRYAIIVFANAWHEPSVPLRGQAVCLGSEGGSVYAGFRTRSGSCTKTSGSKGGSGVGAVTPEGRTCATDASDATDRFAPGRQAPCCYAGARRIAKLVGIVSVFVLVDLAEDAVGDGPGEWVG